MRIVSVKKVFEYIYKNGINMKFQVERKSSGKSVF